MSKHGRKLLKSKPVETVAHAGDTRSHTPTAEYENLLSPEDKKPIALKYPRSMDLGSQWAWRGRGEG